MKNDNAVSPIIGVILMVTITIILAVVIATFVVGIAENIQNREVSVTATRVDDGSIRVTYHGADMPEQVRCLMVVINNEYYPETIGNQFSGTPLPIGSRKDFKYPRMRGSGMGDNVVVDAWIDDGTRPYWITVHVKTVH